MRQTWQNSVLFLSSVTSRDQGKKSVSAADGRFFVVVGFFFVGNLAGLQTRGARLRFRRCVILEHLFYLHIFLRLG